MNHDRAVSHDLRDRVTHIGLELAAWTRARVALTAALMVALAIGFETMAVVASAPWWAGAAAVIVGLGLGVSIAGAVDAPPGAELVVCDLRAVVGAPIALLLALTPAGGLLVPEVTPVFALLAVALAVWTALARLDRRARARLSPEGEVCTDCRPLVARRG